MRNERFAQAEAKDAESKAIYAENALKDAENEARAAAAEFQKQEDDYKKKVRAREISHC